MKEFEGRVTQEQEQTARGSIRHKPQPAGELVRFDVAVLTTIGHDVARLADAAEQLVALAKAEIARTSR